MEQIIRETFYNYKISFEETENKMKILKQELIDFITDSYSPSIIIEAFNGFSFYLNDRFHRITIDRGNVILDINKKEINIDSKEILKKYIDETIVSNSNIKKELGWSTNERSKLYRK